jgi:nicotinamide-nucleotide amidase
MAEPTWYSLAAEIGALLRDSRHVLTTVESCTGGGVAAAVTAIAGSSEWFDRGFVTYSNDAKCEMVGVSTETISRFGAVSEQTALAMATGGLRHSNATISLALTGIAGPGGGSQGKPVGTVCFAWALRAGPSRCKTCYFRGDRSAIRDQSIGYALAGVRDVPSLVSE